MPSDNIFDEEISCPTYQRLESSSSSFRDLPTELRFEIYEYMNPTIADFHTSQYAGLYLSCQQVRREMDAECEKPFMEALDHLRTIRQVGLEVLWPKVNLPDGATYEHTPHQSQDLGHVELYFTIDNDTLTVDKSFLESVLPLLNWSLKSLMLRFRTEPPPESEKPSSIELSYWFYDLVSVFSMGRL
jgi:hypothetical protein